MILFKVYSKKTIFKIIFVLLILLLSIIALFTSNREEAAIFHALKEEVTLVLSPSDLSKVYIDGEEIKQKVDEKNPCIYNIKADQRIEIRIEPMGEKVPVEKTLMFKKGKLLIEKDQSFWDDLTIFQWPNQVYEILIDLYIPTKIEIPKKEEIIKEEKIDLDGDNDLEKVQIIKQGDFYFMKIDESSKTLLKDYQKEKFTQKILDINEDGKKEIIIQGDFGRSNEYIEIFQFDQKQMKRIFWEHGNRIENSSNGTILVEKRLYDTVDHYSKTIYEWRDDNYQKKDEKITWWQQKPKWPSTPQNTVKAFFEAYQLGLLEESKGYLMEGSKDQQRLESFIEKVQQGWISISLPRYYFLGGYGNEENIFMAFYYDTEIHSKYKKVKIYEIELENVKNIHQGPWKIKNIKEVKDDISDL
ncbi:hypothetical protein [Garciella nitratireducens]|uniref:hypothetical protein n=1 Tax=Garciella nitratireducens TaxID=218205 RepID=UPI000DE8287E|nr:hypothetical protein [Garciella nitratireducens]RBP46862.1 hypothetical protein DFR81_101269 [Garciella nitratireducens]